MVQRLEIVRGTTNTFQISVTDAKGAAYNLGSGEKIVFGVKRRPEDKELLIVKTAEILYEGLYSVRLEPEDTMELDFGRYSYDVGLDNGVDFFNVIEPSPFMIVANITSRGCTET